MRAAVVTADGHLAVEEVPGPEPGTGDVLVRVAACGICGSDLHMLSAGLIPPGAVMGHEPSGVVEAVGTDASGVCVGDAVAIHPMQPCGTCDACTSGATQRCLMMGQTCLGLGTRPGAYAEYVTVPASEVHRLPEGFPVELGALAEPLAVALHGLRRSRLEPGMTVGVIGCGPIGLCAVVAANALGAGEIWACDPNEFRAELAAAAGASRTSPSPLDADIVVEAAGAQGTVDLAVNATRGGGQVVLLAVNLAGDNVWPFVWVTKEVEIVPALAYTRAEYGEAAEMIASGAVDVAPLVTRRVLLEETDQAFTDLLSGSPDGKVLVTP